MKIVHLKTLFARLLIWMVSLGFTTPGVFAQCNLLIPADTLTADYFGSAVGFCVELDYEIALRADRFIDGVQQTGFAEGCEFDTLTFYPYGFMPDALAPTGGPYRVVSWEVGASTLSGDFADLDGLISLLNSLDPGAGWLADPTTFNIVGGNDGIAYGPLRIEQVNSGITRTSNSNTQAVAQRTLVVVDGGGFHEFVVDDPSTGCRDTLILFLRPVPTDDFIQLFTDFETVTDQFCLDNSELLGTPQAYSLCQTPGNGMLNDFGGYCFTYNPALGFSGTDVICFEVCDDTPSAFGPVCQRTIVEIIVASPPTITTDTLRFTMTNRDTSVCISDLIDVAAPYDVVGLCNGATAGIAAIPGADGCVEIQPADTFSGQATFCVEYCSGGSCDTTVLIVDVLLDCDLFTTSIALDSIPSQGNPTAYCLPIDPASLASYDFLVNATPYSGPRSGCDFQSTFLYNYAPLFGNGSAGPYTLQVWEVNSTTFSGSFNTPTELEALMDQFDPQGGWTLSASTFSIEGGQLGTDYGRMRIIHNASSTLSNLDPNEIDIARGTSIEFPGDGEYEISITDPNTGCVDELTVVVGEPLPVGTLSTITVPVATNYQSDLSCLFPGGIRDTVALCGDVSNGVTDIDGSNCVVYTPDLGFVGNDTLCAITCDLPGALLCDTTIMIFEVRPRVDTIFVDNFGDAAFTACAMLPFGGPYADATICGTTGPVLAEAGATQGCISIDPEDGVSGNAEVCAIFCQLSDTTVCQEVLFVVTQTPSCVPGLFTTDTLIVPDSDQDQLVCLADGQDLSGYTITVNGDPIATQLDSTCGTLSGGGGTRDAYFYGTFLLPDGEYRIEGWDINGQVLVMNVTGANFAALADSMTTYDPTLTWEFDPVNQGIVASAATGNYSPLILFDPVSGSTFTIGLQTIQVTDNGQTFTPGTAFLTGGAGMYEIEVIANDGSCGDRQFVIQRPGTMPTLDTLQVDAFADQVNGPFCVPIDQLPGPISSSEFCEDPQSGNAVFTSPACISYTPNPGFVGDDTLCVVLCSSAGSVCDTTILIVSVTQQVSCDEIWVADVLNEFIADCSVETDFCLPALPDEFFHYTIHVDGVARPDAVACGADSIITYSYGDVAGAGQVGPYAVQGFLINGEIRDGVVANAAALVDSFNVWDPRGSWVQNSATSTIRGGVSGMIYNTLTLRQVATDTVNIIVPVYSLFENQLGISLDTGSYEIVVTDTRTACTDTLALALICSTTNTCDDIVATSGTSLTASDCDSRSPFVLTSVQTPVDSLEISVDGVVVSPVLSGSTATIFLDTGAFDIQVFDPVELCAAAFTVTVACEPCENIFDSPSYTRGTDCDQPLAEVCLPIQSGILNSYTIAVDGVTYTGMVSDCDEQTVLVFDYSSVVDEGLNGPYSIDSFEINGEFFSTDINSIASLADTLSEWDPTASWQIDTSNQQIFGGNPVVGYGALTITQIASNLSTTLIATTERRAAGVALQLPAGSGTRQLTFDNGAGCVEEITLNVVCVSADIASDTLNSTESIEFCVDQSELTGPIVSFENVCPDQSGIVNFDFDGTLGCVTATGVLSGSSQACLVACDANGVCDTTYYTVFVNPNPGDVQAVDDEVRIRKGETVVVSVTANDTFALLTDIRIVQQPGQGTAFIDPAGILTYTPDQDQCGFTDSLIYEICEGAVCSQAIVRIRVRCEAVEAFNSFTPNGDGINEFFVIDGILDFPGATVYVYNRWGNQVLEVTGYQNDWDGMWDGNRLISGTYFYLVDIPNEEPVTGWVQIWR